MFAVLLATVGLAVADPGAQHITGRGADRSGPLDCTADPCAAVLPGAARFEAQADKPYAVGIDAAGEPAGWVVLSSDVVDIKGYSGKPLHTLVGLDTDGVITGGRVVHHSEPILLVGIPDQKLSDFVDAHTSFRADDKVIVGGAPRAGARVVDAVSGATVTVLAESQTVMESARVLAEGVGVIAGATRVPGHFVLDERPWTWSQIVKRHGLARLTVSQAEMGKPPDPAGRPFLDLWFGVVDAPQIGIPLLGEGTWKWATGELSEGEHLFVVFNGGTTSFKGSGFVRGGMFDRFRLEQGLRSVVFRDMDYTRLPGPALEGAPELPEGGLFVARNASLDPGARYELVYLASAYATQRGAFERDYASFSMEHRVPRSIYVLDGPDPESFVWRSAWRGSGWKAALVAFYYILIAGFFAGRRWMSGRMQRLRRLHTTTVVTSFVLFGLVLHVQPSVTQVLTVAGTVHTGWDWGLFLSDPVLFVSWIGIVVLIPIWGRGVFCGWICPYGALNELAFKAGRKLGLPEWELPDRVHIRLRHLRYVVLGVLLAVFLTAPGLGERMAEVEPFKSTFFVPLWTRHPGLILWWAILFGAAFTTYRPFCRYLCPLGAALALPSSFRLSGPYRRAFCSKCTICTRGCEPRAIRADGTIDPRECLNCWECEANWRDDQVCPPLVRERRDRERAGRAA